MLSVMTTTLFGGYIAFRAWSVPDSPPIPAPFTWTNLTPEPTPSDRDAAPVYREAGRLYWELQGSEVVGVDPITGVESRVYRARGARGPIDDEHPELVRRQILSDLHQASVRPECRFLDPSKLSIGSSLDLPPMNELAQTVNADFHERMRKNDLAGAWEDVEVLLRMAHHLSLLATDRTATESLQIESDALILARQWALDPGTKQTPEQLHAAITAYQNLPKVIPSAEVLKGEGRYTERSIDEIDEYKIIQLSGSSQSPDKRPSLTSVLYAWLISPPWERERARRLARTMFPDLSENAALEPFQRDQQLLRNIHIIYDFQGTYSSSPLLRLLVPWMIPSLNKEDENLVERRALVQIMAIRGWQLKHDGQFPHMLEKLVPAELPALPLDPYSGQPFHLIDASLRPTATPRSWPASVKPTTWPQGTKLLYSVGQNQRDERGLESPSGWMEGDIIFGIPPIKMQSKPAAATALAPAATKPADTKPPVQKPKP
jgi:hypothetical protein